MTHGIKLLALVATLLAAAGVATASPNVPCPECDDDGPGNENNTYSSVDVGVIEEEDAEALADTDVSTSDSSSSTFFLWFSLCLSAFLDKVDVVLEKVGLDLDANAEVYASDEGVDLDVNITEGGEGVWDFDDSELGDLDGQTWEAMAEVRSVTGVDVRGGVGDHVPSVDVDVCVQVDLVDMSCL